MEELHENFSYKIDHVGQERQPILIIDNFLSNASTLVDFATNRAKFGIPLAKLYPGIRSTAPEIYTQSMIRLICNSELVLNTFQLDIKNTINTKSDFSIVTTKPNDLHPLQTIAHFDTPYQSDLICLHYLSGIELGGTSLYRHRSTCYEYIDVSRRDKFLESINQEIKSLQRPYKYINGSNDFFERIASYDSSFNRLIVYRCSSLHSGDISTDFLFDIRPETGRLTLNTFVTNRP